MRKVLIVVFGFATFGALASVQPAFAVTKKKIVRVTLLVVPRTVPASLTAQSLLLTGA